MGLYDVITLAIIRIVVGVNVFFLESTDARVYQHAIQVATRTSGPGRVGLRWYPWLNYVKLSTE